LVKLFSFQSLISIKATISPNAGDEIFIRVAGDEANELAGEMEQKKSSSSGPITSFDLIVIGAGPSGLFCAINSSHGTGMDKGERVDKRILILEKNNSPGRKLLISGSGQCNITHEGDIHSFLNHYGDHGRLLRPAILGFTNRDIISYFETKGLEMEIEPEGKVFPQTRRSRDVLDILLAECRKAGIEIVCQSAVRSVEKSRDGFALSCEGCEYRSPLLVIATGGCSYPATGSTGDGYRFARSLGHSLADIGPALTPLMIKEHPFSDLAGISFEDMKISLQHQEKKVEMQGDVLFTHDGLSGPAILDLSRHVRSGDTLRLSFVPREKRDALERWMLELSRQEGGRTVKSILSSIPCSLPLPPRLCQRILEICRIQSDMKISHLRREERMLLIDSLVGLPLVISNLGGFDLAMVTRGGVNWKEINLKTMQSRLVPGLYITGEVLDVDGDTGGYNLQSCFSTAMLASRSIRKNWDNRNISS